jgi:hypothetical protein
MTARSVLPTGNLLGAGRPESLVRGELNPNSPVIREQSNNTSNIIASQLAILPSKSRVVLMGRIVRNKEDKKNCLKRYWLEPAQVSKPVFMQRGP